MKNCYQKLKQLIFCFDPEKSHNLAIKFLKYAPLIGLKTKEYTSLRNTVFGVDFQNPIGMAAGFDKNAEVFSQLFKFGFGFAECGTVTPKAQIGNPKPRIFRLIKDQAIINRLGFNNCGIEEFSKNFQKNQKSNQIIAINIGKNKDTINAIDDYIKLLDKVYGLSSYITINISSPNTKNLRDLQKSEELNSFLTKISRKKERLILKHNKNIPILLKIAPDLDKQEQKDIAQIAIHNQIDGLIISNTTISQRDNLVSKESNETGGLSGKPLFELSNQVLSNIYKLTEGKIPIIGVGGISSAEQAYKKIKLGASLVQIYSSFIYKGFGLVEEIKAELDYLIKQDGFDNVKQAIGSAHKTNSLTYKRQ